MENIYLGWLKVKLLVHFDLMLSYLLQIGVSLNGVIAVVSYLGYYGRSSMEEGATLTNGDVLTSQFNCSSTNSASATTFVVVTSFLGLILELVVTFICWHVADLRLCFSADCFNTYATLRMLAGPNYILFSLTYKTKKNFNRWLNMGIFLLFLEVLVFFYVFFNGEWILGIKNCLLLLFLLVPSILRENELSKVLTDNKEELSEMAVDNRRYPGCFRRGDKYIRPFTRFAEHYLTKLYEARR